MNYAIGVDIGGTKVAIAAVNEQGSIINRSVIPTNLDIPPEAMIAEIQQEISRIIERSGIHMDQVVGIGIGAPGPLDSKNGLISCPPNLPAWVDIPIRDLIGRVFPVPVLLENDANAAALAEKWIGAATETDNFIYITVSTGIGAGIISDGQLLKGVKGNAGDIGHAVIDPSFGECVCGQSGCLESIASGTAIAKRASAIVGREVTAKDVFHLYKEGNPDITAYMKDVFNVLGVASVSMINTFDPEKIVFGGGVSEFGEPMFESIQQYVRRYALNPTGRKTEIAAAKLGQNAGVIGAAALCFHNGSFNKQESEELQVYEEPIFLEPVFQDRIWGGKKLHTLFGYDIPSDKTGEAWVISAHEKGPSIIANGLLKGRNLLEAWNDNPTLFGKKQRTGDFPLLVKILDANESLSVQVHPDAGYAQEMENVPYGKAECWYVLDCEPNSQIILGHRAESREDFRKRMDAEQWDELLLPVPVKKGDFFYIPSGTVHAIGNGIMVLEIQQSSDITYRVYDYGRKTGEGKTRELHIQSAIDVINFPHHSVRLSQNAMNRGDLASTQLIKEPYFTVYHWDIKGKVETPLKMDYLLVSVIDGSGEISVNGKTFPLAKGSHFILPAMVESYGIEGDLELMVTHE